MEYIRLTLDMDNSKDKLDEEVVNCILNMSHPREVLLKSKELKEEGNEFFRRQNFHQAARLYELALQFASVGIPSSDEEASLMMNLGISINLNVAACCLKVGDFDLCVKFSSYVLKFDKRNVKALFRRAMAYIELQLLDKALGDLQAAFRLAPNDKEVVCALRKLEDKVLSPTETPNKRKGSQSSNSGRASFEGAPELSEGHCLGPTNSGPSGGPVDSFRNSNPLGGSVVKPWGVNQVGTCSSASPTCITSKDQIMEEVVSCVALPSADSLLCAKGGAKSSSTISSAIKTPITNSGLQKNQVVRYSHKRKPNHSLTISSAHYERIIQGESCEFYDKHGCRHMIVRKHATVPILNGGEAKCVSSSCGQEQEIISPEMVQMTSKKVVVNQLAVNSMMEDDVVSTICSVGVESGEDLPLDTLMEEDGRVVDEVSSIFLFSSPPHHTRVKPHLALLRSKGRRHFSHNTGHRLLARPVAARLQVSARRVGEKIKRTSELGDESTKSKIRVADCNGICEVRFLTSMMVEFTSFSLDCNINSSVNVVASVSNVCIIDNPVVSVSVI